MVMGHTYRAADLKLFIYAFHIPLFFFLSGLFFNPEKYSSLMVFLKKKSRALLYPYVTFYIGSFFYWITIERYLRPHSTEINLFHPVVGLFYGTDYLDFMQPNGALWFLTCLFTGEMLLFLLLRKVKNVRFQVFIVIAAVIVAVVLSTVHFPKMPWGFNSALFALIFLYGGYFVRYRVATLLTQSRLKSFVYSIILFSCMYFISFYNGLIDMDYGTYQNPVFFIVGAYLGIVAVLLFSKFLINSRILKYLGLNSLIILGVSEPIKRAVIGVVSKLLHVPIETLRLSVIYSLIIVVVTILIIIPVIFILNNYFFYLIGKNKPFRQEAKPV